MLSCPGLCWNCVQRTVLDEPSCSKIDLIFFVFIKKLLAEIANQTLFCEESR